MNHSPEDLHIWLDSIPLPRPKRSLHRDFADGTATAQLIHHFIPKLVDLHNYPPANGTTQKTYNWRTLNQKVLKKLGCTLSDDIIDGIINNRPGYIEFFLEGLKKKIEKYLTRRKERGSTLSTPSMSTQDLFTLNTHEYGYHPDPHQPQTNIYTTTQLPPLYMPPPTTYIQPPATYIPPPTTYAAQPYTTTPTSAPPTDSQETIIFLTHKIHKLEQLLAVKDEKIKELELTLRCHGIR